jgi:hypothetical protein
MTLDKSTLGQLKRYADAFRDARDRVANEADTVMYLIKFFEEVLGYDSLKGEISKELQIKDRYCDLALKVDGTVHVLVEGKAASVKELSEKHIEQAENYASRAGIRWVTLTNGIEWKLYRLSFAENEGINHDLAFEANLLDEVESDPEGLWAKLSLLSRFSVQKDLLEDYLSQKKALSPTSVVHAMFSKNVLRALRRELNRKAPARLELRDVFNAIRDALSKEALLSAGDITLPKIRRKHKKATKEALLLAADTTFAKRHKKRRQLSKPDLSPGQPIPEGIGQELVKDEPAVSSLAFSKGSDKSQAAV